MNRPLTLLFATLLSPTALAQNLVFAPPAVGESLVVFVQYLPANTEVEVGLSRRLDTSRCVPRLVGRCSDLGRRALVETGRTWGVGGTVSVVFDIPDDTPPGETLWLQVGARVLATGRTRRTAAIPLVVTCPDLDGDTQCDAVDPCPTDVLDTCVSSPCGTYGDHDLDGVCTEFDACPMDPTDTCVTPDCSLLGGDVNGDDWCDFLDPCGGIDPAICYCEDYDQDGLCWWEDASPW